MPVCGIRTGRRDKACRGNCGSPQESQRKACCSSSVFLANSCKTIHQPLSQAHNVCRSHGKCQRLRFDQRGDVGKAVSMRIKSRVSAMCRGRNGYGRI